MDRRRERVKYFIVKREREGEIWRGVKRDGEGVRLATGKQRGKERDGKRDMEREKARERECVCV